MELSWKKCSEVLGSWKIYWWAQKTSRGHLNHKKGHHNFGFWDRADVILLAPKFWWFGAPEGSESSNFVFKNWFWLKILSKTFFWHAFSFSVFEKFRFWVFPILSFFWFSWFLKFLGVKLVGGWVGSLPKLFFTPGGYFLRCDVS